MLTGGAALSIPAEVLPEDRAEALYHRYEGVGDRGWTLGAGAKECRAECVPLRTVLSGFSKAVPP